MANNDPANDDGQRYGAEHGAQIAAINQLLDSMEESLLQAIRDMRIYSSPANITGAPVMLIYTAVKIIRQKLIFKMGRQDMVSRFQLAYALIAVALGCVACSLLMYILLGDMPWQILVLCILMLIISSSFQPEA